MLESVETAFPGASVHVYTVDGQFYTPAMLRAAPSVAAANWAATARAVAMHHPDALLVDIGTTTTDLVPIVGGTVVAAGHTDPERLMFAELLYTGALRTPAEAIASYVPLGNGLAGVSAEAAPGDVHVWWRLSSSPPMVPVSDSRRAPRHARLRRRAASHASSAPIARCWTSGLLLAWLRRSRGRRSEAFSRRCSALSSPIPRSTSRS